jgi:hypothetical protein
MRFLGESNFSEKPDVANLLKVEELAELLKVPISWVYSRTRETGPNSIPRLRVGKYIRFQLNEVLLWLKKQDE